MMEMFVINNMQKNLNITFKEFMALPILDAFELVHYTMKLNKKILELKKTGTPNENDNIY